MLRLSFLYSKSVPSVAVGSGRGAGRAGRIHLQSDIFFFFALSTGVAAGVARLFLGWQLPPHATPVDPPMFRAATTLRIARHLFAYIFGITNCMQICTLNIEGKHRHTAHGFFL